MYISSELWDWVAALTGLRANEGLLLPFYWSVPSWLTASWGWVPTPSMVLWALIAISLVLSTIYYWRRNLYCMIAAYAIWGALVADTPYIVIVPLLVKFVWSQVVRFAYWRSRGDVSLKFQPPTPIFLTMFAIFAFGVALVNFGRFQSSYVIGYARNAILALRTEGRLHPLTNRAMDSILNEYVTELARESAGYEWVFTDGLCDTGVELASGGTLKTISLAGDTLNSLEWRKRGFTEFEDISALESGAVGLLRAWAVDRPENLKKATYQCGFTFLEKTAPNQLVYDGLVMKSAAGSGSADALRALAKRIIAFYEAGENPAHGGRIRNVRFCAMQWRVARAIRRLALSQVNENQLNVAIADTELSEKLDELNPFAKRANSLSNTADLKAFGTFTPRESLAFALSRANFGLAKVYAKPILKDDPQNPEANFAMAMNHLQLKEYLLARHYFLKVLEVRPNEPAILNNLAATELELGELAAAKDYAERALKVKPNDAAIKNTLRQIELKAKASVNLP